MRKIVCLSPTPLGDFVFALPALHALKHAYPDAELVLIGKQWHAELLRDRAGPVDRVLVLPPFFPGVTAEAHARLDPAPADRFVDRMRAERFDLAVQMFGGGLYSNPLVGRFGARLAIGARADDAPALDRWVAYSVINSRRLALLEVVALAGAYLPPLAAEFEVADDDRAQAAEVLPPVPDERLVVLQPGVTDPRRRWPAENFAAIGDMLAGEGATVAVNGSADEAPLVGRVIAAMRHPAHDLSGKLPLRGLCGLLERAVLMVSNDTGPLHLALAVGTRGVGIFWLTNLVQALPLRQSLLRAAMAVRVHCPVCGAENLTTRCPHDDSFVADVTVDEVAALVRSASL
ncbi:MAG: glycosyltransferase family 9 protein [Telluria sp.]